MSSEDYSVFVEQGVPSFYFTLGVANTQKFTQAKAAGVDLPSNHSPLFAPDATPGLHTGIAAEVAILRDLLQGTPATARKFTQQTAEK
jgi:hippurate hydrolase